MDTLAIDKKYVWHPFTQAKTDCAPLDIVKGEGALLYDSQGKSYIDIVSSWWVAAFGHGNEELIASIVEQASSLQQVLFASCTHPVAAKLAKELSELVPGNLTRSFFSDNGSCAVEIALKMCIQFYANKGIARKKFIAFKHGYHGDTIGTMSVGSPNVFNSSYEGVLFKNFFIDPPFAGSEHVSLAQLEKLLDQHDDIAGFIFEPLLQGAGGMLMHDASGLDALLGLCKDRGIFCIADEIFTGFYRTGSMFACDQLTNKPDIVCLSKALTGGALPLGVTVASEEIFEGFWSDERRKLFWHGHSFTANALACAAALKSVEIFRSGIFDLGIEQIQAAHENFRGVLSKLDSVENVRQIGVVLAFDVRTTEGTSYVNSVRDKLYRFYLEHGVLLRPLGNTVYLVPPYCITEAQLTSVYDVILASLAEL